MSHSETPPSNRENDIAIVGMAAHLPGARSVAQYWQNLRKGVESIRKLSPEDLEEAGVPRAVSANKNYVPVAATLEDFHHFDGEFFGFSPKESAILDPQHRQFLEVSWEAFEHAGHKPEAFSGPIGIFAGCGMGSYFYFNLCSNRDLVDNTGMFLLRHTGNDKDFLATRASHVFDLRGPSINVQTACSTSLVATHMACQALLNGECDMALAGGVTIELPHGQGYLFKENEILSPDGHCHAFDARAEGTVFGSGAGAVVLRRLEDAIADNDQIWGVIKGSAVNNDGAAKAGYLAPSVDGQSAAISEALAISEVSAETVDYVECHGTGTYLGDPIEVAALTDAFGKTTDETGFCRIGSVKTNIGHLDTAAGVASLIKTTMALHHKEIPASLGYDNPNPTIDFEASPFVVNDALAPWVSHKGPRRAGVNSLGVGGTNAHVVLEEAPERAASEESDWPFQLLTISGRSSAALEANAAALATHLRAHPEQPLADVAYTLQKGRRAFEKRRVVVASSHEQAAEFLEENDPRQVFTHSALGAPEVVFMFPGGGAQYAGMARDLYETEPVFQEWMDRGLDILQPKLDYDIRALWLPENGGEAAADARLKRPSTQLPLIMIVEHALAQLWMAWGVQPRALVGHSMGENTAACLAGVMSFEDCIGLVHLRGTLFDTVPAGGMLSVPLSADALKPYLGDELDLASVNAPELSVASGPQAALDALAARLAAEDIECLRIPIDIAAHSQMLEPILEDFRKFLESISLNAPQIPIISNRSGMPLTEAEATDPDYWVAHLRGTVNFADCITHLAENPERVFLEVGPGKVLGSLAAQNSNVTQNQVVSSLRHPDQAVDDDAFFVAQLGRIWAVGADFDWAQIWGEARRNRVVLPTYAFQCTPYFIEAGKGLADPAESHLMRTEDPEEWGYRAKWLPKYAGCEIDVSGDLAEAEVQSWLIFAEDSGLSDGVMKRLEDAGHSVVSVRAGDAFSREGEHGYILSPERGREGYDQLLEDLCARGITITRIAHLWQVTKDESHRPGSSFFHRTQEQGFYSLMFLAQAIASADLPTPLHITAVTTGAVQVGVEALPYPEKATLQGPARVIPQELVGVTCATLDILLPEIKQSGFWHKETEHNHLNSLINHLLGDLLAPPENHTAARRAEMRYELAYRPYSMAEEPLTYREGGTYLITGGFGGIGLSIARDLIKKHTARIVLLSRSALPPRDEWDKHLVRYGAHSSLAKRIKAVRQLEDLGGEVLVLAADVSNVEDMRAAVEHTNMRFGQINGVIHAAGVIDDAPLMSKSVASVEDVFTPKIHGTQVLNQLFPDGALDWLVLFSSTSTATAPAGQIDYVAANEYLNAYANSRCRDKTRVRAINWGVWREVGMAADAMEARTGNAEAPAQTPAKPPLLDLASFNQAGDRVFLSEFFTQSRWVLDEHRTKDGGALLPGTAYLELAAEALAAQGEEQAFEIRNLYFLRPLDVSETGPRDLRVTLERNDLGYDFTVQSSRVTAGRKGFETNAEATLSLLPLEPPSPLDIGAITARCANVETAPAGATLISPQEAHLDFGPRWRVLNKTCLGEGEGLAHLRLPKAFTQDLTRGYLLHPGLMDLATGWAMRLIKGYAPSHLWVPVSYQSVRVFRSLPAKIVSHVRNAADNTADAPIATFDITIADESGAVCAEITGFSIKRLEGAFAMGPSDALEYPDASGEDRPLSPAEERLQHNISQGIDAHEGVAAFHRALASDVSQVIYSSLPLPDLIRQTAASGLADESLDQKFERPDLETEYLAPQNDIEARLAQFWGELLGVEQVGVEDNFFDLGGHSLIAVRLFAMVKKAWSIEFPISVLFEAPTIRKCAEMIAARGVALDSEDAVAAPSTPERRFTHVVPMHSGEGSSKTPFFLIAGMFGNVLNLRHLAHLLGDDRPFYGMQARGLYGDETPHSSITAAAADYIGEMRQVQPRGPYMLGGFSGGGIIAYEIAQQLKASGEEILQLVMLDTPLPMRRPLILRDRLVIQWLELKSGGVLYPLRWAARRIKWELGKRQLRNESGATPEHHFHNTEIEAAFLEAVSSYEPTSWSGPLALFRPPLAGKWQVSPERLVSSERAYVLPDNDWSDLAAQLEVFEVPGDHDSMVLEPNVRVLAARIRASFAKAETPDAAGNKLAVLWPQSTTAAE